MLGKGGGVVSTKRKVATEENVKIAIQIESSQHVEVACRRMNKFYSVKG